MRSTFHFVIAAMAMVPMLGCSAEPEQTESAAGGSGALEVISQTTNETPNSVGIMRRMRLMR